MTSILPNFASEWEKGNNLIMNSDVEIFKYELSDHPKDLIENDSVRVRRTVAPEGGPSSG